jgi:hypothetical protein
MFNPFDPYGQQSGSSFAYGTSLGPDGAIAERLVKSVQAMQAALASSGTETDTKHVERMVTDRNNLLFFLHLKFGIEVVEIAQLVNMPWTSVYDIVDAVRAEHIRKQAEEEAKAAEAAKVAKMDAPSLSGIFGIPVTRSSLTLQGTYGAPKSYPRTETRDMAVTQFSSLKPIKEDEPPWSFEEDDDAYVSEMDVMPEQREE